MMHAMGARRRMSAVLVALAATLTTTATAFAVTGGTLAAAAPQVNVDRGSWQVQSLGGDRYQVSWRSPALFPLIGDRPTIVGPKDVRIGAPTTAADGRTVRAV